MFVRIAARIWESLQVRSNATQVRSNAEVHYVSLKGPVLARRCVMGVRSCANVLE
jgi:hypothetical protein